MREPDALPSASPPLSEVLRLRRTNALLADAQPIRQYPEGTERDDQARRFVREPMLFFALKNITSEERDRLTEILSFVTLTETPDHPGADAEADRPLLRLR
jgi:hypothetical protein